MNAANKFLFTLYPNPDIGFLYTIENQPFAGSYVYAGEPLNWVLIQPYSEWERLARRLLGAMNCGFRIETDSGHRYIVIDLEAANLPESIRSRLLPRSGLYKMCEYVKEYGSVNSALDVIDKMLVEAGGKSYN